MATDERGQAWAVGRPIIFSGPMVRAIIEGRKRQTRRVIRPQPTDMDDERRRLSVLSDCPYGRRGSLLWVRETCYLWRTITDGAVILPPDIDRPIYQTDPDWDGVRRDAKRLGNVPHGWVLTPSIHMPRWASRLTLRIADVRVQRLQDISEEDAMAEGIIRWEGDRLQRNDRGARTDFVAAWDSINSARGHPWAGNPYVWAISYEVAK